jgi:hypothetical protein
LGLYTETTQLSDLLAELGNFGNQLFHLCYEIDFVEGSGRT